jgi:hypothetical protein
MPTSKSAKDTDPTPQPEPSAAPAAVDTPAPAPAEAPDPADTTGPPPGVYAYSYFADCVYPHVPLSARAATADAPATIFDWPFGPPDDGRWTPTSKSPNQAADNAPAPSSEE